MGVPQNELFADPLGIRKGSTSSAVQQPRAPQSGRDPFSTHVASNSRDLDEPQRFRREEEEEEGWLSSFVGYVIGAGKQCASMRDRTCLQGFSAPQRPPQAEENNWSHVRSDQGRPQSNQGRSQDERRTTGLMQDGNDPFWQDIETPKQMLPDAGRKSQTRNALQPPKGAFAGGSQQQLPGVSPRERTSLNSERTPSGPSSGGNKPPNTKTKHMPEKWEWPTWCLNFQKPSIEVYVIDDETGDSKWVLAEPQSRVVDKNGCDTYLCAEYKWDGEFYVQDFGPQHVRRRGEQVPVSEVLAR